MGQKAAQTFPPPPQLVLAEILHLRTAEGQVEIFFSSYQLRCCTRQLVCCHPRSPSLGQGGIAERPRLSRAVLPAVLQEGFTAKQRIHMVPKTPSPLNEEFKGR